METTVDKILKEALNLPVEQRVSVVEQLISSLDKPDPAIDALWRKEVEHRVEVAAKGGMTIVPKEKVFGKYKNDKWP